jgi:hypothetical protein
MKTIAGKVLARISHTPSNRKRAFSRPLPIANGRIGSAEATLPTADAAQSQTVALVATLPLTVTRRLCATPSGCAQSPGQPSLAARSAGPSFTGGWASPPRPSRWLDVVSATPSPSLSPCGAPQRRLDALATKGCEKCGLVWWSSIARASPGFNQAY